MLVLLTCSKRNSDTSINNNQVITVKPKRSDELLINPGKGWVLMSWMPNEKSEEALALATTGYIRFDWAALEPEEGKYNWEYIDKPLDEWSKIGKQFAFGVMCANVHSPREYVTPKWVYDTGVPSRSGVGEQGQKQVNPESWENPIFLEKLGNFIHAMGKRYDDDPRISYIDIRSYGNWGEGHLYKIGGEPISQDGLREHIRIHQKAFKKTRLILPWGTKELSPVYDWAVEQGIGMRRDGVLGNSNGEELVRCMRKTPAVIEWFGSYDKFSKLYEERNLDFDKALFDATVRACATYQNLGQYRDDSDIFLKEKRPLIEKLTNLMGYHFVLWEIKLPKEITLNNPIKMELEWENRGLAPIFVPCYTMLALIDDEGIIIDRQVLEESDCSKWEPGKITRESVQVKFDAKPGKYRLAIGLFTDRKLKNPDIRLGIETDEIENWYILGEI